MNKPKMNDMQKSRQKPVAMDVRPRSHSSAHSNRRRAEAEPSGTHKTIDIRLTVPSLRRLPVIKRISHRVRSMSRRRRLVLLVAFTILIIGIVLALCLRASRPQASPLTQQNPLDMLEKGTPDYPTLLPAGTSVDKLSWTRTSPKDRNPVYTYVDYIGKTSIRVSQQPLPDDFKIDTDAKIRNLALGSNATKKISAGGTTVYLGASSKGRQPAIFTKDSLLILIDAVEAIPDDDWKSYIDSLR